jgi:hypothetical protein
MTAAGRKQNKVERLSKLPGAYRLADIYAFGSRAAEIAAVIRENKALKRTSSSDVDIGVRPKQSPGFRRGN